MTDSPEKKTKRRKEKTINPEKKLSNYEGKETLEWTKEFSRLCVLVRKMFHQIEQDIEALEPLPQSAAAKKTALAERNGILSSVAKLVQLFSELTSVYQQLKKMSGDEEDTAIITEADLELIEQYFKKCRETGTPLLGTPGGQ